MAGRLVSKGRGALLAGGVAVSLAWLAMLKVEAGGGEGEEDLYMMTVVSLIVVSSVMLGEALKLAPPILEVIFGMVAGWMGAGIVEPLELLAVMGGSAVLFMAGLEVDVGLVREFLVESLAVGLAGFAASSLTVLAVLHVAYGMPLEAAALVAVAVSTTGVAVVYTILKSTGYFRSRAGQVVLASAMAADAASIIAFMALIAKPSPALALYILSVIAGPYAARKALGWLPMLGHEAEVRIIVSLLLASTLISEVIGVHGVLASFILGLALQDFVDRPEVRGKVEGVVMGFLAPAFFVVAGLEASSAEPRLVVLPALGLLALSFPAKIVASGLMLRRLLGIAEPGLVVSLGARLTVSTLIAYMGVKLGLISPLLGGAIMLSAALATLMAGLLSRNA